MQFLNPTILWGILTISIPILLHFLHQKKGKILAWATSKWLIEENKKSKNIYLNNLFLLLLRCSLLILTALLLSKPLLNGLKGNPKLTKIHLVEPSNLVVNSFKFEIEEALKNGEKLYWISPLNESIKKIEPSPSFLKINGLLLQNSINDLPQNTDNQELNLYFVNNKAMGNLPHIYVPNPFKLHTIIDSSTLRTAFLLNSNHKYIYINSLNQLVFDETSKQIFETNPRHNGTINVLIEQKSSNETRSIQAALKAITEVFQIDFSVDYSRKSEKKYDLVFNDSPQSNLSPFSVNPQLSSLVFNGELAEYLTELIVEKYHLQKSNISLSPQQLKAIFNKRKTYTKFNSDSTSKIIFILIVIIFGIERWLSAKNKV